MWYGGWRDPGDDPASRRPEHRLLRDHSLGPSAQRTEEHRLIIAPTRWRGWRRRLRPRRWWRIRTRPRIPLRRDQAVYRPELVQAASAPVLEVLSEKELAVRFRWTTKEVVVRVPAAESDVALAVVSVARPPQLEPTRPEALVFAIPGKTSRARDAIHHVLMPA